MSSKNVILSVLQKNNAKQSAINSAFDNENEKAAEAQKKDTKKQVKK